MERQRRVAVINDMPGFGRCAAAVAQPIISAMQVQCCVLPTAILSTNTAFSDYIFDDYTDKMLEHMRHWEQIGVEFDGISTGFLGSSRQIQIVIEFIERFRKENTIVLVDPIMGDHGKLYATYTEEMCTEMKRLVRCADVLTPNLTEACKLLDIPYIKVTPTKEMLDEVSVELSAMGPKKIVITGIQKKDSIINYVYEQGKKSVMHQVEKIGEFRSGTGDVFSAIVISDLIKGKDFYQIVKKAVNFISKSVEYTNQFDIPCNQGICFEQYMHELVHY